MIKIAIKEIKMETKQLQTNVRRLRGQINIPGDKSISHRAVMFGAIAEGKTTIANFLSGEDCLSTISCFRSLGVDIRTDEDDKIVIYGNGFAGLKEPGDVLNVGNSGTTIRLLLGILSGRPFFSVLNGDDSIRRRPMTRVTKPLARMGAVIDGREGGEFAPLAVRGGNLKGMEYNLPVASAQVKSSLLFAGMQAEGETTIIEPSKTRDHTERMIKRFGGDVAVDGLRVTVKGGQTLYGTDIYVPGDISSAAFFLVAGAVVPDSEVILKNVGLNPTRTGIIDVMKQMGTDLEIIHMHDDQFEPSGDIRIRTSSLKGTEIGGKMIPRLIDEIPIIALLATQAEGTTIIRDAEELKVKESNRIDTVVNELTKLGAEIEAIDDGMIIHGPARLKGGTVDSHGDHRIGMMLAIAALICDGPVHLANPEAIAISYPEFFTHLQNIMS